MVERPDGSQAEALARAADALAHLVSGEQEALVAALHPLQQLVDGTSAEIAVLVVSQLCAGVVLGCADLLGVDPVRLVRDAAEALLDSD